MTVVAEASTHGGALDAAMAVYGGVREDWLDLSTGINPVPPPLPQFGPELWTRLPDRQLEAAALAAARRFYRASESCGLVAAPGSQALISLLPHLVPPTRAAVLEPSYSEHRRALAAAGHEVAGISGLADIPEQARLVVLVNPNNPDGRVFPREALLELARSLAARGGLLVVDEAFMDCDPRESLAPFAGAEGLLVHRSFGKFFGYAGLRLGFALAAPALAERLRQRLGPWAVSGPALAAAPALFGDDAAVRDLRAAIAAQAERRDRALAAAGLERIGSTGLFALVRHERAGRIFEALCRRHVLTRPFEGQPDWLRFGNPAGPQEAERLAASIGEAFREVGAAKG